jgi:hypothetical protein
MVRAWRRWTSGLVAKKGTDAVFLGFLGAVDFGACLEI